MTGSVQIFEGLSHRVVPIPKTMGVRYDWLEMTPGFNISVIEYMGMLLAYDGDSGFSAESIARR